MAEAILTGAAANVLSSLGSYAIQHIGLPSDVKVELRKMETNISTIKDVLLDAEERQMSNRAVKGWLERLKLILYDAEDLLDEVATETKRRQVESLMRKVYHFFISSNPLVFRYVMGCKIRDIGKRLDEIVLQMNAFKFVVKLVERPIQINRREETSSFVNTVTVIGRDADKEKLVRLLLSSGDEENVAIIPIVGMGGLGKTTFAQLVYNDDRIQKHFTKRLWVCISNDFDFKTILIKLLQAGYPDRDTRYSSEGLEQLQYRVRNLLRASTPEDKFILFLDDVWTEERVEWKKLEDLLITQARGSRIVVTTRSKMVASIVKTRTVEPYELRGLSNNECLDILVKCAFKEGDESKHPNLVNIGKEIVKKCGGVPLAARTLGAFLFSKTNEQDWLFVRDNQMWAIVQKENDILPILRLSYNQMPSYLRHCFAYFSLFEKDEIIFGTKLIHAWMALGFVQNMGTKDELEDIGEGYILELVRRSFLERDYTIDSFNPVKRERYKMHDLVHDLAQYVAGNEFLTIKGSITEAIPETVRHVSFDLNTDCSFRRPLMEAEKLRTIVYPSNRWRRFRSPVEPAIASFRSLRVLEGLGLPENIGKLKLLRYISTNASADLPNSLCMLLNLQYLDLSESNVYRLPEDFCKLISLRFLALTTSLTRLPKQGIGRLTSLRTLFFYNCFNLESLGEGIEHLSCLRDLVLRRCSNLISLPAGFRHLTSLECLDIDGCESLNLSEDDDLKGLRSLKKLELRYLPGLVNLPKGLLDAAATLTRLEIGGCENFTSPSESVLPNLLSLQSLTIEFCRQVASLPEGMQRLTELQDLWIYRCRLNNSRYRKGGEDWPKIAHVTNIKFHL
ncbi:disease resistance protein RGA2-like [Rhododendron vialii]|uniref:disease resistance protein RGA2-like n=1 Tax=Rhododendron vialii TaxID=182163 RepID=UPI00265E236A|nr:disease resistance protein RGA2-like [Rhododendron vialii]XP_058204536.1 disease resistance protein RGA2-like [Rhododendron vialii]XP_058204537.1 disease resistance protein RGA2-like [Rhododendron vialii]